MAEIFDWDTTAANNNSAPPNGWPEGMAYNAVNDTGREDQAVVARNLADDDGSLTSGGSVAALTLTSNRTITSLFRGLKMTFRSHVTTTGSSVTLNLNGIGAVNLQNPDGTAPILVGGGIYEVVHDGTRWQMLSTTGRGASALESVSIGSFGVSTTLTVNELNGKLVRLSGDITIPAGLFTAAGTRCTWFSLGAHVLTNNTGGTILGNGSESPTIFTGTTGSLDGGMYTLINLDATTRVLLAGVI